MPIIISSHPVEYRGNILFRVYENRAKHPEKKEVYCFEVLTRDGARSKYAGHFTCEHLQAVKTAAERVANEHPEDKITCLELANEIKDYFDHQWIGDAFARIKRDKKYSKED